jgi:hypothetical protein
MFLEIRHFIYKTFNYNNTVDILPEFQEHSSVVKVHEVTWEAIYLRRKLGILEYKIDLEIEMKIWHATELILWTPSKYIATDIKFSRYLLILTASVV